MHTKSLIVAALVSLGANAAAQPVRGSSVPPGAVRRGSLATMLIEARRELNLTPRQLLALDSLERAQYAERAKLRSTMRARRDSVCANRQPCDLTRDERLRLMGGTAGPGANLTERVRRDSVQRSRIMGMLDSTQRRQVERLQDRRTQDRAQFRRVTRERGQRDIDRRGHDRWDRRRGSAPKGWYGPRRGYDDRQRRGPNDRLDSRFDRRRSDDRRPPQLQQDADTSAKTIRSNTDRSESLSRDHSPLAVLESTNQR